MFVIFYRVLGYFQGEEGFGDILAYKLLSMTLITFFSLLIFSAILTSLSKLYLAKDLSLVHSMPVSREKLFLARWMEAAFDSSWMVFFYSLPVFLSYGIVYRAGVGYYAMVSFNLLPFCLIASSLSVIIVMVAAVLLPAGRIRSVFVFLGLLLALLLVVSFRLIRPEKLVNPESFNSLLLYLKTLESPSSPVLPTTWFSDTVKASLSGLWKSALFHTALLWSGALTLIFISTWVSGAIYFKGLSKSQTSAKNLFSFTGWRKFGYDSILNHLSQPARAFIEKEIKSFFRDQTQWSQIFLVMGLIVIYLFNFSVLPLQRSTMKPGYLQNLLSFLNMGLAAFVLSAVSVRFVFPAVSLEGEAFWIVRASPISIRTFLWTKFFVYFIPLLILSELLVVLTNLLLGVTPFMMVLSVLTVFSVVPGIVAMGIGLGAIYPDFKSESPTQSVTSLGGLIYMSLCMCFIAAVIVLEAGPVYSIFMTGIHRYRLTAFQWGWIVCSFATVLGLCAAAVLIPMRKGEQKIVQRESV
jgi:ABC-2 type transport system permease protein